MKSVVGPLKVGEVFTCPHCEGVLAVCRDSPLPTISELLQSNLATVAVVVENYKLACSLNRDAEKFDVTDLHFIAAGSSIVGRGYDMIIILCRMTKKWVDEELRCRLYPGGRIIGALGEEISPRPAEPDRDKIDTER